MNTKIVNNGFVPITEWESRNGKIKLRNLKWTDKSGWLYAFVVNDEELKYIGLTTRVLRSRMDDYSYITEEQCKRIRKLIRSSLDDGNRILVYGNSGLDQNRIAEEENRLIRKYSPPWNRT